MQRDRVKELRQAHPLISNTELAYDMLYEDIITGRLKMGQKIPQEALAESYEMSRSPLRDALLRLEREGFVERDKGNGFRVCTADIIDYIEYSEFRVNLESFSAFYGARNATDEQIAQMERYVRLCEQAASEGDIRSFCKADEQFHLLIAEASCNQYVMLWFQQNRQKVMFYRYLFTAPDNFDYPVKQHRRILRAIREHEENQAAAAMEKHTNNYIKYLRSKLKTER